MRACRRVGVLVVGKPAEPGKDRLRGGIKTFGWRFGIP
jgi:hypothetical protein